MGALVEMPSKGRRLAVHLQKDHKTKSLFEKLVEIHDASFDGVQRPPVDLLKNYYLNWDTFVLYLDDVPVGFAIVIGRSPEMSYLWTIAVHPEHRGKGVGERLLREIAVSTKNPIELTCKVDNPAQKLYFDNGYRVTGLARDYYGVEGHGLMMRKERNS